MHTPHSVGLLWTSDQPDEENSTWSHTTLTRHRHPFRRGDSKPQSQQASGSRPTPETARPLISAYTHNTLSQTCRMKTASIFIVAELFSDISKQQELIHLTEVIPLCSVNSHIPSDKTVSLCKPLIAVRSIFVHRVWWWAKGPKYMAYMKIYSCVGRYFTVFLLNEKTVQRVKATVHGKVRKLIIIKILFRRVRKIAKSDY